MDAYAAQARVGDVVRAVARHKVRDPFCVRHRLIATLSSSFHPPWSRARTSRSCRPHAQLPRRPQPPAPERCRHPAEPLRPHVHRLNAFGRLRRHRRRRALPADIVLIQKHRLLHLRLSPLREVDGDLHRRLGVADLEFTFTNGSNGALSSVLDEYSPTRKSLREFGRGCVSSTSRVPLKALLTFSHSFFPDTVRIMNRTYIPSDNDVVRARLHPMGVQEWHIHLEQGAYATDTYVFPGDAFGSEWVIYNVGGSRSMRHVWLPYFDAVNAIIVFAPELPLALSSDAPNIITPDPGTHTSHTSGFQGPSHLLLELERHYAYHPPPVYHQPPLEYDPDEQRLSTAFHELRKMNIRDLRICTYNHVLQSWEEVPRPQYISCGKAVDYAVSGFKKAWKEGLPYEPLVLLLAGLHEGGVADYYYHALDHDCSFHVVIPPLRERRILNTWEDREKFEAEQRCRQEEDVDEGDPIQDSSSQGEQDPIQEFTSDSTKPPTIARLALQAIESPHPRASAIGFLDLVLCEPLVRLRLRSPVAREQVLNQITVYALVIDPTLHPAFNADDPHPILQLYDQRIYTNCLDRTFNHLEYVYTAIGQLIRDMNSVISIPYGDYAALIHSTRSCKCCLNHFSPEGYEAHRRDRCTNHPDLQTIEEYDVFDGEGVIRFRSYRDDKRPEFAGETIDTPERAAEAEDPAVWDDDDELSDAGDEDDAANSDEEEANVALDNDDTVEEEAEENADYKRLDLDAPADLDFEADQLMDLQNIDDILVTSTPTKTKSNLKENIPPLPQTPQTAPPLSAKAKGKQRAPPVSPVIAKPSSSKRRLEEKEDTPSIAKKARYHIIKAAVQKSDPTYGDDDHPLAYSLCSTLFSQVDKPQKWDGIEDESDLIERKEFLEFILIPHIAASLIAQDLNINLQAAVEVLMESGDYGQNVNPYVPAPPNGPSHPPRHCKSVNLKSKYDYMVKKALQIKGNPVAKIVVSPKAAANKGNEVNGNEDTDDTPVKGRKGEKTKLKGKAFADLETPPNNDYFDKVARAARASQSPLLQRRLELREQAAAKSTPAAPQVHFNFPAEIANLLRPAAPAPPIADPNAFIPLLNTSNMLIPPPRVPGPELSIEAFCLNYSLDPDICDKFKNQKFKHTTAFKFVEVGI
ncbi:hypothetical protein B0H14DRAFT_3444675 [Mycena olivaceomarginata]|nr:hypothetical protein B0H14DRAFT_3444675 [Mycena olivaceomarginata]